MGVMPYGSNVFMFLRMSDAAEYASIALLKINLPLLLLPAAARRQ